MWAGSGTFQYQSILGRFKHSKVQGAEMPRPIVTGGLIIDNVKLRRIAAAYLIRTQRLPEGLKANARLQWLSPPQWIHAFCDSAALPGYIYVERPARTDTCTAGPGTEQGREETFPDQRAVRQSNLLSRWLGWRFELFHRASREIFISHCSWHWWGKCAQQPSGGTLQLVVVAEELCLSFKKQSPPLCRHPPPIFQTVSAFFFSTTKLHMWMTLPGSHPY